jgi:DNA replication protein DnaC
MKKEDIRIVVEKNTCSGCGKEYDQPALVSQFGVILSHYCPECIDKEDRRQKAIENQIKDKKKKEWLKAIGVKADYETATLGTYEPKTDSQKEALNACKLLKDGAIKKLVLLGSNGVGKTHLASALVKLMNGKIITAYEMFALYRSCFSGQNSEIELLHKFSTYPLLVIDEFGRTKGSEAEENFLSAILDARHSDGLPTMILSNLIRKRDCIHYQQNNKTDVCETRHCKGCLEMWLTSDLISRLREDTQVILIQGDDYRRKKNA